MKLFKKGKNQLDEMQEQNLRKLESWGFWLTWGALLLSILIQMLVYKDEAAKYLKGEWIVFMASCLFMLVGCVRLGIWPGHPQLHEHPAYQPVGGTGHRDIRGGVQLPQLRRYVHSIDNRAYHRYLHLCPVPAGSVPLPVRLQKAASKAGQRG